MDSTLSLSPPRRGGKELLRPRSLGRPDNAPLLAPRRADGGGISLKPESRSQAFQNAVEVYTHAYSPKCLFFFGRRGQCKTATMTAFLAIMQKRNRLAGRRNHKIMSNYWVQFADKSHPYLLDQLQRFPEDAQDATVALDEVVELLPSSKGSSNYNLLSVSFLKQLRKRRIEVLAATQFANEASHGFLRQIDLFVETEKIGDGRAARLYWYDFFGHITGRRRRASAWPPTHEEADCTYVLYGLDQIWGKYKTEEIVAASYSPNREDVIARQWEMLEAEGLETSPAAEAPTFHEILALMDRGDSVVAVRDLLMLARTALDGVDTQAKLRHWLEAKGYDVYNEDDQWMAGRGVLEAPPEPVPPPIDSPPLQAFFDMDGPGPYYMSDLVERAAEKFPALRSQAQVRDRLKGLGYRVYKQDGRWMAGDPQ